MNLKNNDTLQTPKWVYTELGCIDLDPCAGIDTRIAATNWAIERGENGLEREWFGFVYCNPPFSQKEKWAQLMIKHGNGILILPERGSAPWFGPLAMAAGAYMVMGKKINFVGGQSSNNLGSALFPFGDEARDRLLSSRLPGHFVEVMNYRARECA
ncbi:MAG: DNA N-6-adenine-methyltransferase [Methylobacter sp.]|nr:DNA N-6-adenine-methyltransferase [Methylobacter sp.]